MTAFTLKIIALVTMIFDHVGYVFAVDFFRVIGRVAFPIFVFFIAEGFRHTKNPAKYLARLGAFALISEVFFDLVMNDKINFLSDTNIFYTLFLGGGAIFAARLLRVFLEEKTSLKTFRFPLEIVSFLPVIPFMLVAKFLSADYGAYGVAFIFLMYVVEPPWRIPTMAVLCAGLRWEMIWYLLRYEFQSMYFLLTLGTMIPALLVAFYNGKRGPSLKWFFYVIYPLHLAVLVLLM